MAGFVRVAKRLLLLLLLLPLITTGVAAEDGLISAVRAYDIAVPCEGDLVCFHIWQIDTLDGEYIGIVSNGELQTAETEEDKCNFQIQDITAEDVGRHRCQKRTNDFSLYNTAPVINLTPAKTVSLQCVFLSVVEKRYCLTKLRKRVSLMWVDEAGAEIQADSQHHIMQRSSCDITLTVTYQSPENMTFRCQATVARKVFTSVELQVRASGLFITDPLFAHCRSMNNICFFVAVTGKGRGLIYEIETEYQGYNRDTIGAVVGVVACVALTVAVAVFARRRRRTRTNGQQHNESCSAQSSTCYAVNTGDVIYADIIHPSGSDRVWVHECESTEYASVQYK
uniref:uncharacterized protein LOC122783648 isoform X1 n=1 Tax=Solea senegalensis TaxID=28829 RepID=UPI001CD87F07|nr:uncharacterized protein LOC122783648 isoform X1 [Solea senegalensis]